MNSPNLCFLLLTGFLGDPDRNPLTVAQFRELTKRVREMDAPTQERELEKEDLLKIGCNDAFSERVLHLLSQEEQALWYLKKAKKQHCFPILRMEEQYPAKVRSCLGLDAPACLWGKGNLEILDTPMIALVGSRDLFPENLSFAREVGKQAALQGYTLVSGNARGADREAQDSCLAHGGTVVSIVADELCQQPGNSNVLYLSEMGFDLPFSAVRALSRNRLIHAIAEKTFVAQCAYGKGGTWSGTTRNLERNWSTVFCFDDNSESMQELAQRGATLLNLEALSSIESLSSDVLTLF